MRISDWSSDVCSSDLDEKARESPMQMSMNLKFDMGPRFYITGMGLDAGLLGAIEIHMADGRLTGIGALRTRGGGIEAYGQNLRLRRGDRKSVGEGKGG